MPRYVVQCAACHTHLGTVDAWADVRRLARAHDCPAADDYEQKLIDAVFGQMTAELAKEWLGMDDTSDGQKSPRVDASGQEKAAYCNRCGRPHAGGDTCGRAR